jgi:hypothetical protein
MLEILAQDVVLDLIAKHFLLDFGAVCSSSSLNLWFAVVSINEVKV